MFVHLRQHVVQAVAELVEQRRDIVMRQQRWLAADAVGKVADQMRDWRLQLARVGAQPAGAHIVHPGSTAFAGPRRHVEVKLPDQFTVALDAVERDARLPDGG